MKQKNILFISITAVVISALILLILFFLGVYSQRKESKLQQNCTPQVDLSIPPELIQGPNKIKAIKSKHLPAALQKNMKILQQKLENIRCNDIKMEFIEEKHINQFINALPIDHGQLSESDLNEMRKTIQKEFIVGLLDFLNKHLKQALLFYTFDFEDKNFYNFLKSEKSTSKIEKFEDRSVISIICILMSEALQKLFFDFECDELFVDPNEKRKISEINQPKSIIEKTMCFVDKKIQGNLSCKEYKLAFNRAEILDSFVKKLLSYVNSYSAEVEKAMQEVLMENNPSSEIQSSVAQLTNEGDFQKQ